MQCSEIEQLKFWGNIIKISVAHTVELGRKLINSIWHRMGSWKYQLIITLKSTLTLTVDKWKRDCQHYNNRHLELLLWEEQRVTVAPSLLASKKAQSEIKKKNSMAVYPDSDWEHDGVFANHHNRLWIKTSHTSQPYIKDAAGWCRGKEELMSRSTGWHLVSTSEC